MNHVLHVSQRAVRRRADWIGSNVNKIKEKVFFQKQVLRARFHHCVTLIEQGNFSLDMQDIFE
ncbi:hypothetical protein EXN66_Car004799 [Channa argus]|uniref:Uncharacterized protein n=1 Tax=Channa argus TaxID=215402 RepID=A0A6G1PFW0_CHAAH|nr:hypothetical protein EXN66_Car004799 [Channa argus]